MKALLFDGQIRLDANHPIPERKPFEVLIRVLKAGICRTDLEIVQGYLDFKGILGHEFVGRVEKDSDSGLEGKRVVGEINLTCGKCLYCLRGLTRHCEERSVLGIKDKNGVFAEFITLPEENVHVVPEGVSDEEAVFTEPLAAALEIIDQVHIRPQMDVIVLGDGNLGLLVAQVVDMTGAQILAVGKHSEKLDILKKRGIRTCLRTELRREKADVVIDCTGSSSGLKDALGLVHPRGTIVLKSTYAEKPQVDLAPLVINEINLVGSRCGAFSPALRLLEAHAVDVLSLISKRFPLGDAPEAIRSAQKKKTLKILLDVSPK